MATEWRRIPAEPDTRQDARAGAVPRNNGERRNPLSIDRGGWHAARPEPDSERAGAP